VESAQDDVTEAWWEHLGSSKEFKKKIIERMGRTFYRRVFQPAIRHAWGEGEKIRADPRLIA
jgi:hypothetical protein